MIIATRIKGKWKLKKLERKLQKNMKPEELQKSIDFVNAGLQKMPPEQQVEFLEVCIGVIERLGKKG